MLRRTILIVGLLFALHAALGFPHAVAQSSGGGAGAQTPRGIAPARDPDGQEAAARQFGAWVAVSLNSPGAEIGDIGQLSFGAVYILGLRYGYDLEAARDVAIQYVLDFVPFALLTEVPRTEPYYDIIRDAGVFPEPFVRRVGEADWGPAYGFGISPIGLQLSLFRGRRLSFAAGGTAGFLSFTRDVPVPGARRFNFRFAGDVGRRLAVAGGWGFELGIGFQHVSGGTSSVPNPGLDYRVIQLGLTRIR